MNKGNRFHAYSIKAKLCHNLEKMGIKGIALSHTQPMENQSPIKDISTKEEKEFVSISVKEAEEYRGFKRERKLMEIAGAMRRSETPLGGENIEVVLRQAVRFSQAAIRLTPLQLAKYKGKFQNLSLHADCIIGGNGETLTKVKMYEARLMRRFGAKELTVAVTPSWLDGCRYAEIKKELRRFMRATKKAEVKVWMGRDYPYATIARVGRIAAEAGAKYFSVPYFTGCERLRYDLFGGCRLEVVGVDNLPDFKKMIGAGVGRIVTAYGFDMYTEWMKEAEQTEEEPKKEEKNRKEIGNLPLKFV